MITVLNLKKATSQQVLDQAVTHLLTQRRASKRWTGGIPVCAYRSDDGAKCAAGCFIDDADYTPALEGTRWSGLREQGLVPAMHSTLITELQLIHDNYNPERWAKELAILARNQGLKFNPPVTN